ncbi:MAG TPA: hypothetical protein VIT43_04265 [Candidatus Dormibacteraeota bacterium]
MDRRQQRAEPDPPLTGGPGDLSAEDELRLAFGRMLGFTAAAIILLVGGGILVIFLASLFFGFLYGH